VVAAKANSNQSLIELRELSVQFGAQSVLREIDLVIPSGQTLSIIGESGCGKTVLLKTMIGLVQPSDGYVSFDGRRLDELNDKQMTAERTRFGYVFQNAALFDSMTVAENVAFPLAQNQKLRSNDVRDAVAEYLAEVGLPESVMTKKPAQLSGGMRKRVGLARALAMNPEVILYDEPTTGLDPIMSDVINELIIRTREHHQVTSILVTHDMKNAYKTSDRIVMLYPLARLDDHESQIVFDGTPQEIQASTDKRVAQFVRGEAGERLMEMREQAISS
jgi:phospholipid/cholesterol/gamma-HCH transport system ATP-binding protein